MEAILKRKRSLEDTSEQIRKRPKNVKQMKRKINEELDTRKKRREWSPDDEIPLAILKQRLQERRRAVEPQDDTRLLAIETRVAKRKRAEEEDRVAKKRRIQVGAPQTAKPTNKGAKRSWTAEDEDVPLAVIKKRRQEERKAADEEVQSRKRDSPNPADENVDARRMRAIYYDPAHPAGFGSVEKLAKAAGVNKKVAAAWLSAQDTYTLHKKLVRKFKRSRYMVHDIGVLFQMDLLDMQSHAQTNKGVRYLLMCIDCFTRRLWVEPLIDKRGVTVLKAIKNIFKDLTPHKATFDSGTEFLNNHVLGYLRQKGIKYYTTTDKTKSALVERVNRTLRERMNRVMTSRGNREYLSYLPDLVFSYNLTKHTATGMAPLEIKASDVPRVYDYLYHGTGRYKSIRQKTREPRLASGDRVRLARTMGVHEKPSATFSWTPEVFTVSKVTKANPVMLSVTDDKDEHIAGRFYQEETQKINKPRRGGVYMIDKIIEVRGKGDSKKLLVAWKGYSEHFNSWISEKDLTGL